MRLTACRPLLPLLLLCFNCLAAEYINSEFGDHDATKETLSPVETMGRIPKIPLERSEDDPSKNFPRADFPCPAASAVEPCVCSVDSNNKRLSLDCTLVESEEQLAAVFQQQFPIKEFYEFSMRNNSAVKTFHNFMNGITFERLTLSPGPFGLETVAEYFLLNLKDTVQDITIRKSKIITDTFPFLMLPLLTELSTLSFIDSDINWIPPIRAPKLSYLNVTSSPVKLLENGTISVGPGRMSVTLDNNDIYSFEPGSIFFADEESAASSELLFIDLTYNGLQSLQAGTFPLGNRDFRLSIDRNRITFIEPGTFVLPNAPGNGSYGELDIDLSHNQLQSLQAGTFPLRNGAVTLDFSYNVISSIEPGTFVLPETTGNASYGELDIDLSYNQLLSLQAGTFPLRNGAVTLYLYANRISSIEPGTFVLPETTDSMELSLNLAYNLLKTIDEAVFGNLMPFVSYLGLYGNYLTCGCDVIWLIQNTTLMSVVSGNARCADGTLLHDLNPQDFVDWCLV